MMDPETVEKIARKIYRQFPEVAGIKPKVRKQPLPKGQRRPSFLPVTYLITFGSTAKTANGRNIPRWVRVVATINGRIIKITTSR
jgi:hypothetical protein